MKRTKAFAPAHTTGLFFIQDTAADPLHRGSLGAGFSIDMGVYTEVRLSDRKSESKRHTESVPLFYIDGVETPAEKLPVSISVYHKFLELEGFLSHSDIEHFDLEISHTIEPPQGSGFGTSGSGALSLALALNASLEARLTAEEAAGIAHVAEVENRTGLGTVIGEYFGGFEIRTEAGAPGYGKLEPIAYEPGLAAVFAVFGPYSTRSALSDHKIRERINDLGRTFHAELLAAPTVENFLEYSSEFSKGTGLLTEKCGNALRIIEACGYTGAMLMFGDAVFTLLPKKETPDMEKTLKTRFPEAVVFSSPINSTGGKVI